MTRAAEFVISHLVLTDECPRCKRESSTDWGGYEPEKPDESLPVSFACTACGIEWWRDMTIKAEFGEVRDIEEGMDMECPECGDILVEGVCTFCALEDDEDEE